MAGKRKHHTATFKAQVALAALKGDRTVNELASHYEVHPTLIHGWKKQFLAGAEQVFSNGAKAGASDAEAEKAALFEQIGRLQMELEWLKTAAQDAVTTPVFHDNRLLLSGLMLKLDPDKPAASILWPDTKAASRRTLSVTSTPLFRGDYLFSATSSGALVCVDAGTGERVWETDKVTDPRNGASIHLIPNGGGVFLHTDKGELIRAQLTPKGCKEISRTVLLKPVPKMKAWPAPAFANRHVFVRNDEELICASLSANP
jgi:transposase-like protein